MEVVAVAAAVVVVRQRTMGEGIEKKIYCRRYRHKSANECMDKEQLAMAYKRLLSRVRLEKELLTKIYSDKICW